VYTDDMRMAA